MGNAKDPLAALLDEMEAAPSGGPLPESIEARLLAYLREHPESAAEVMSHIRLQEFIDSEPSLAMNKTALNEAMADIRRRGTVVDQETPESPRTRPIRPWRWVAGAVGLAACLVAAVFYWPQTPAARVTLDLTELDEPELSPVTFPEKLTAYQSGSRVRVIPSAMLAKHLYLLTFDERGFVQITDANGLLGTKWDWDLDSASMETLILIAAKRPFDKTEQNALVDRIGDAVKGGDIDFGAKYDWSPADISVRVTKTAGSPPSSKPAPWALNVARILKETDNTDTFTGITLPIE